MPHKRAKASQRLSASAKRGYDNAPTQKDKEGSAALGGMSKSLYRVLNAEKIRNDRKMKGKERAALEPPPKKKVKQSLEPRQHESLRSFNQRVEEDYRPDLSVAYKTSRQAEGRAKKKRKRQEDGDVPKPSEPVDKPVKDWTAAPKRSRLNDIAVEPPALSLKKAKKSEEVASHRLPITLAQQAAIEEERQKAIAKYRELRGRTTMPA